MIESTRQQAGRQPSRLRVSGSGSLMLALIYAALLFNAGCTTLPRIGEDDGIEDHDLQVELGTAKESPADLYVNMAAAYLQRGQIDAALARAKRGVKEDRKNPRAHYMLAIVYQQLGEQEQAEKAFHKAVQMDSRNPDYRNAWGVILCRQQRYKEADEQFQRALDKPLYASPEVALTNAADCAKRSGDPVAAERYWRQALEKNPAFAPALLAMAEQSLTKGDPKAAHDYMGRYSQVGQATPKALLLAVRIERARGNKKGAKALEGSLRSRFPDAPELMELTP